jgi:tetratricopeptide (TPR) repeat protein
MTLLGSRKRRAFSRLPAARVLLCAASSRGLLNGLLRILLTLQLVAPAVHAQTPTARTKVATSSATAEHGIALVQKGNCDEAIPLLQRTLPRVADKQVRYHAEMGLARCGMGMQQRETAVQALLLLEREYPDDPEVLYIATHYFSELGTQASQQLTTNNPKSFQARKLQAESLESQGKTTEAQAIYSVILEQNPKAPGIHYRLGQILLAVAGPNGSTEAAQAEFEKEIQVDPTNAAAEFIVGELARRQTKWPEAIQHFSRATSIDAGFSEAYLALGMTFAASADYPAAVAPLERYVKLQPDDPAGHYQLAMAYRRLGNSARAAQEIALQNKAATKPRQTDTTAGHEAAP